MTTYLSRTRAFIVVSVVLVGLIAASVIHSRESHRNSRPNATDTAFLGTLTPQLKSHSTTKSRQLNADDYGRLPMAFEPNRGQGTPANTYSARGRGYALFLGEDGSAIMQFTQASKVARSVQTGSLHMSFVRSEPAPLAMAEEKLPGTVNYLVGNDPRQWQTGIPTYAKVRYRGIYPGIDLVYYGNQQNLEYDLIVSPGADVSTVELQFSGATHIALEKGGGLRLELPNGTVHQKKPIAYQESQGKRVPIIAQYTLESGDRVGLRTGPYDPHQTLIIDPVLSYSTYFGGSNSGEEAYSVAVDECGNAFVTGYTNSTNFPTTNGVYQTSNGGGIDVYVSKFSTSGSLVYSTYIGGSSDDYGFGIGVDSSGNAYVTGRTDSTNFPTASAYQGSKSTGTDAFVLKLNSTGTSLSYSTYLGGNAFEQTVGIAVDGSGNAYVAGLTASTNFPTSGGGYQTSTGGGSYDAFVTKFDSSGSLSYSTYLGSSGDDEANAIAIDSSGNAYIAGFTTSTTFPTSSPIQSTNAGGTDAFVAKFDSSGASLIWSTYLGGSSSDFAYGIAVDPAGAAYVAGYTNSTNFPTTNPYQASKSTGYDYFITKINAAGSSHVYSTYFGGNGDETAVHIAVDESGGIYLAGSTASTNLPTANPIQGSHGGGGTDGYVAKFTGDGSTILFATYHGGSGGEGLDGVAVDNLGDIVIVGSTTSSNFPTANAYQGSRSGSQDGYVTKISRRGTCN